MSERRLRFRLRRGTFEAELEGDFDYVRQKFEIYEHLINEGFREAQGEADIGSGQQTAIEAFVSQTTTEDLQGVLETTPEGKPSFSVPFDAVTAKEAIGLMLYRHQGHWMGDTELSEMLSSGWKTTKPHVIRARASELRRDGKLVAERGKFRLSGAGVQWIRNDVLPRLKQVKA